MSRRRKHRAWIVAGAGALLLMSFVLVNFEDFAVQVGALVSMIGWAAIIFREATALRRLNDSIIPPGTLTAAEIGCICDGFCPGTLDCPMWPPR